MAALGFVITGLGPLVKAFSGSKERTMTALEKSMAVVAHVVAGRAAFHVRGSRKSNPETLLGVRTGRLRQAIVGNVKVTRKAGSVQGVIGAGGLVYAAIHELGGDIYPVRAKALRFVIDGRVIFAQHVRIPARPYFGPALAETREYIVETLGTAFAGSILAGGA
jgi:phage gpG-like protein